MIHWAQHPSSWEALWGLSQSVVGSRISGLSLGGFWIPYKKNVWVARVKGGSVCVWWGPHKGPLPRQLLGSPPKAWTLGMSPNPRSYTCQPLCCTDGQEFRLWGSQR